MGRLIGIARRQRPKVPMETLEVGEIRPGFGVCGDFRGALKQGRNKREVTVMALEDWQAAINELGKPWLDWWGRRANLLTDGVSLPRRKGALIRIEGGAVLEVTGETDPCDRMEAVAEGLRAALTPDWRGGVTTRVLEGGPISIGVAVEIDE